MIIRFLVECMFLGFRTFFRLFNRIEVEGLEKIPKEGALIVACNHLSLADPPAVCGFTGLVRKVSIIAKKELLSIPLIGPFLQKGGAIFVDRSKEGGDMGALRASLSVLRKGGCFVIFPEGTRSKDGKRLPAKSGVALFAHKTGAPVLAARIFNSNNYTKLGKIVLKYGNMRKFEVKDNMDLKQAYAEFSEKVLDDVFAIK